MQIADRADIRVAGIGAVHAGRVGHHGLQLGPQIRLRLGQHDVIAVALGHLASVQAGQLGAGREQHLRLGQDVAPAKAGELFGPPRGLIQLVIAEVCTGGVPGFAGVLARLFEDGPHLPGLGLGRQVKLAGVQVVEAPGDLTGQLHMRHLIGTHRHEVRFIEQDVRRLQQRVAEEAVGVQVLLGQLRLLILEGGHALQPAERRKHAEQRRQPVVLQDVGLPKDDAAARVKAGGQEVQRDLEAVLAQLAGVGVVGGQRVKIGNEEEAVVLILQLHPVVQGAHVVAQVQLAGGSHAAENARARGGS